MILQTTDPKGFRMLIVPESDNLYFGKYICSNCQADWVTKLPMDDRGDCCSNCGIPDMDEYKIFVRVIEKENAE